MKIEVSFKDILDVKNEEECYDSLLSYFEQVVDHEDLSAFIFELLPDDNDQ